MRLKRDISRRVLVGDVKGAESLIPAKSILLLLQPGLQARRLSPGAPNASLHLTLCQGQELSGAFVQKPDELVGVHKSIGVSVQCVEQDMQRQIRGLALKKNAMFS